MASPLVSLTCTFKSLFSGARFIIIFACSLQLIACSSSKNISSHSTPDILSDTNLLNAHVGISIYDPQTNKYLYTHQADKYFIPASNTKLFTCYAAMKHLGDSLVGLRYLNSLDTIGIIIFPTGDPSLLHTNFKSHPVFDFLKKVHVPVFFSNNWTETAFGNGWAWNDYDADYMPERSALPICGNVMTFEGSSSNWSFYPRIKGSTVIEDKATNRATRLHESNTFKFWFNNANFQRFEVPFRTEGGATNIQILEEAINKKITPFNYSFSKNSIPIHSQPTDSLLKPMMHRSDNFFAEQTLLMVSNEMMGVMNDAKIIDSLLKTDLKDLPQKPRWVDGSGLSRYNLFSPNDMVHVLNKMKTEFDWNRITTILPTGGEGTLSNYYINLKDKIFAKTGTLSNNIALSGFLITKQNKTLIFSVLINNHMGNTTQIRRAVERFLTDVSNKY